MSYYEIDILNYLSSVGVRAQDTKSNKMVYQEVVKYTCTVLKAVNTERIFNEYMHFLDCIANNIMGVEIYEDNYNGEPSNEELKSVYYTFKELHKKIKTEQMYLSRLKST